MSSIILGARVQVLGAALLFSTGGAAIKSCELGGWQIASLRSAVAGLVLWLLLPAARRGWTMRTLLVGVAYAVTLVAFVNATKATSSASAIFLQSAAPLYLLALAPTVLGERIARRDLWVMGVMALGLALCFLGAPVASAASPDPVAGNLWGAVAGFAWAWTMIGLRALARSPGVSRDTAELSASDGAQALRAVVAGNILAFLGTLPMALPGLPSGWLSVMQTPSALDLAIVLYLGAIQIALAYVLLSRGVVHVPAFEASILLLAEPVLNPLWTFVMHGEVPTLLVVVGGVLILSATTWKTWADASYDGRVARAA